MEHLNDNLGQEASNYLDHNQKVKGWLKEKLNSAVGGYFRFIWYNGPHEMNPVRRKRRKGWQTKY